MSAISGQVRRFAADDSGATAIEYGLIAALLAIGILAAMSLMGGGVESLFNSISSRAGGAMDAAAASS